MRVAVIGGGIFGAMAASEISELGHQSTVFEASGALISRASQVNQARLHTGLHYPRDFETASRAKHDHDLFQRTFARAVKPVTQFYAIAEQSGVSFDHFREFAGALGHQLRIRNPQEWFREGKVTGVLQVRESSIDASVLRELVLAKLGAQKGVRVRLSSPVLEVKDGQGPAVRTSEGWKAYDYIVIATYAMNGKFAKQAGVLLPDYENQLTELVLGRFAGLSGAGITVMDGPFWSTMPFGQTGLHSLSNVSHTPITSSVNTPLPCQQNHGRCGVKMIYDCGPCSYRPPGNSKSMVDELRDFIKPNLEFEPLRSIFTVKSLPYGSHFTATAARPSQLFVSESGRIVFVHSGKLGSSIPLARDVAALFAE